MGQEEKAKNQEVDQDELNRLEKAKMNIEQKIKEQEKQQRKELR